MRKILIASPILGDVSPQYMMGVLQLALAQHPDISFGFTFVKGSLVNFARNEIADYARKQAWEEVVFWDKDLKPSMEQWGRLLSHREKIVCAVYARRTLQTDFHILGIEGEAPREDGLQRVTQSAIGFAKIETSVFETLAKAFPWRRHRKVETQRNPIWQDEFFPVGVTGKNTPEGKLERIRALRPTELETDYDNDKYIQWANEIAAILDDTDCSDHVIMGEDFGFCQLARQAGIPIYIDTHLIIPHTGEVEFPVPTATVEAMLTEEWRKGP